MAQGVVASAPLPINGTGPSSGMSLTAEELREILEYDRIVQFRDAVLAGTHPRVKIPPHLIGKPVAPSLEILSSTLPTSQSIAPVQQPLQQTPRLLPDEHGTSLTQRASPNSRLNTSATRSEINPILLEKSDDLIKAEIQLQRQKLEKGLREQIEQQRIAAKAALQTFESLPDFDLSEVLSKALAIVQSSVIPEAVASVGNRSSASDSFDERTFYSSQHDTPESSSSQGAREFGHLRARNAVSPSGRQSEARSVGSEGSRLEGGAAILSNSSTIINNNAVAQSMNSSMKAHPSAQRLNSPSHEPLSSGNSSSSNPQPGVTVVGTPDNVVPPSSKGKGSSRTQAFSSDHIGNQRLVQQTGQELLNQAFDDSRASPLIRAHNLSPHAPQPARVSPLATARDPPILRESRQHDGATPAQVAALRHVASGLSSTDSSPKAGKVSERKKKKEKREKKRKNRDNVAASPESPYIKPEPQSPEPFAAAPLPRPQKRQRQSGQFASGLSYDEPHIIPERLEPQRTVRGPREYQRIDDIYEDAHPRVEPVYRRVDDGYRPDEPQYVPNPSSAYQYPSAEGRILRPASVVERRMIDEPRYYREQIPRANLRSDIDRDRSRSPIMRERESSIVMAPPRRQMRVVIDEFGNEYLEPASVSATRQTMAPPVRYREQEVIYERAPTRAVSARIPADAYEEGGVIYRRASPPLSRRVVTQPEYASAQPEYRSYRQREFSVRPSAGGQDFIQIRAPERRPVAYYDEQVRELTRAPSARPEPVRYEVPGEYAGRLQSARPEGVPRDYSMSGQAEARRDAQLPPREYSVRPDVPPREYAPSVRPDLRRDVITRGQREYSVRPVETAPRREYLPVQGEGYYEERRPAEVAFIERPRARDASVVVYADDVRREVYR